MPVPDGPPGNPPWLPVPVPEGSNGEFPFPPVGDKSPAPPEPPPGDDCDSDAVGDPCPVEVEVSSGGDVVSVGDGEEPFPVDELVVDVSVVPGAVPGGFVELVVGGSCPAGVVLLPPSPGNVSQ